MWNQAHLFGQATMQKSMFTFRLESDSHLQAESYHTEKHIHVLSAI